MWETFRKKMRRAIKKNWKRFEIYWEVLINHVGKLLNSKSRQFIKMNFPKEFTLTLLVRLHENFYFLQFCSMKACHFT